MNDLLGSSRDSHHAGGTLTIDCHARHGDRQACAERRRATNIAALTALSQRSAHDAILDAVTDKTKLVFLANPNNPTGTYLPKEEIDRLRDNLPRHIILLLDAAYCEYVENADFDDGMSLVDNGQDNVIVCRTFSKIYGLSGLRVGWGYAPEPILSVLHRIRGTFNINSLSQQAAILAVQDQEHVKKSRDFNNYWLPIMTERLEAMGLTVTHSPCNFLLVHFNAKGNKDAAQMTQGADQYLRQQGIIVRPVANYGLTQSLRITIGRAEENEAVLQALEDFLRL